MLFALFACQSPSDDTAHTDTAGDDTAADTAGDAEVVTYDQIAPILDDKCAGCHYSEPEGLPLVSDGAYDLLVSHPSAQLPRMFRVYPGSLEDSYLWHKLEGTHLDVGGEGEEMPSTYGVPLTEQEHDLFRAWILDGARP
jgi:hypothetical protein